MIWQLKQKQGTQQVALGPSSLGTALLSTAGFTGARFAEHSQLGYMHRMQIE
jgi:hypothetical protein